MSPLSSLNDYWRLHSDELAERILASYPPLYGLDDAPSLALSQMLRTPYPAQSLTIMGVAKRWQISRGAHVVAECGAGKTLIALGMMFVHAQGQPFSGIVMAPPHLVEKWARETFLTLPQVRVFMIDDMRNGGDPRQPHGVNEVRLRRGEIVREGLHTTLADLRILGPKGWRNVCPESSIFIFGRERAKLGYFWKHVYLKARAGKHLGLVLNPDTSKPISTDDVPRELADLAHCPFGLALQHRIFGHRHHVLDAGLGIQKVEQFGMRKAAIETNANARCGKKVANQLHQSAQNPHRTGCRRHVAGAQHGGAQIRFRLVIKADETHYRQVAPAVVMSVEKRQLLRPLGGIVGRIQIEGDAAHTTAQPLGMALDHAGRQRLTQTIEFLPSDGVLKTRQRRLRSQIATRSRIAVQQQLVNRIGGQAGRIVGVRIAARDREHTLRQKFFQRMIDLARLPLVPQTPGQTADQSIATVGGLQQQGSAIGTALPLIELQHGRLGKNTGEQQTLCCAIVRHAKASLALANTVSITCL